MSRERGREAGRQGTKQGVFVESFSGGCREIYLSLYHTCTSPHSALDESEGRRRAGGREGGREKCSK